jgi:hypothetical protein
VDGRAELAPINEFQEYWDARYLTATEATYRTFGYHITMKEPSVTCLPVHIPESRFHTQFHRSNGQMSSMSLLSRYFHRPTGSFRLNGDDMDFDSLTYTEYYRLFRLKRWNANEVDSEIIFPEHGLPLGEVKQLAVLRTRRTNHITRLAPAKPSEGERFYIRSLLQRRPARSFKDLRTFDTTVYPSFQHAAIALGIFVGEREAQYAMAEAVASLYTPSQLRRLYIDILVNDCTDTPLELWEMFREHMSQDYTIRLGSQEQALAFTLRDIAIDLQEYGKTPSDFGLPHSIALSGEIEDEFERWAPHLDSFGQAATDAYNIFTQEQVAIYDDVLRAVTSQTALRLFIDGKAGRGKTFLLNAICAKLRSMGRIVIATAVSAFAAQLYQGGKTAHSVFKVRISIISSTQTLLTKSNLI